MELEIENIGPIKSLAVVLPDSGVAVFRGRNGSGKSTALRSIRRRMGGEAVDLSTHDGAKRGTLLLGEAQLTVNRARVTQSGELEVLGIDGTLDIDKIVDPGILDHEKADAARIKRLVGMSGLEPDPALLYKLCGGEEAYKALGVDEKGADVLTLFARTKRAIEAQARAKEETAAKYLADAKTAKAVAADVDTKAETDEQVLAAALAKAQSTLDQMNAENDRSDAAAGRAAKAAQQLRELGELSDDFGELAAEANRTARLSLTRQSEADELRKRATDLEAESVRLGNEAEEFTKRAIAAKTAAEKRRQLVDAAAAAVPAGYDADAIAAATAAVDAARQAVQNGAVIRNAVAKAAEGSAAALKAKVESKAAKKLRDAAQSVDGALSDLLPKQCPLRVVEGRLTLETDRGPAELFSDLSLGEKWRVALEFAAKQLPPGGLLTLDQTAWESFAPSVQQEIATLAKRFGVLIVTAQVDDGDLRAEVLQTERERRMAEEGITEQDIADAGPLPTQTNH